MAVALKSWDDLLDGKSLGAPPPPSPPSPQPEQPEPTRLVEVERVDLRRAGLYAIYYRAEVA